MSSIPERSEMLWEAVKSIVGQVDAVMLCLNNYDIKAAEDIKSLHPLKIKYIISDNRLGDGGKFYFAEYLKGYALFGDDDMTFPHDYVQRTIEGIEKYSRKAIVSHHGRTLRLPIESYYNGALHYYSFKKELRYDAPCHVIGTGCMGYHTDTIKISLRDFPSANMADIHFSIKAHNQGIPLIVLAHKENWIRYLYPESTIYDSMNKNEVEQVTRLKKIECILAKRTAST